MACEGRAIIGKTNLGEKRSQTFVKAVSGFLFIKGGGEPI